MKQDEIVKKVAGIVLDVYRYILDNNLDITSHDDVLKALNELKLNNDSNDVDVDTLIQGLVALDKMTKADVAKREGPIKN